MRSRLSCCTQLLSADWEKVKSIKGHMAKDGIRSDEQCNLDIRRRVDLCAQVCDGTL